MNSSRTNAEKLWQFACTLYRQVGVEQACLELQTREGWSVPLLLFVLWAGRFHTLSPRSIVQAKTLSERYTRICIKPLRSLRIQLKTDPLMVEDTHITDWREQLKSLELGAERLLLNQLALLVDTSEGEVALTVEELQQRVCELFLVERGSTPDNLFQIIQASLAMEV